MSIESCTPPCETLEASSTCVQCVCGYPPLPVDHVLTTPVLWEAPGGGQCGGKRLGSKGGGQWWSVAGPLQFSSCYYYYHHLKHPPLGTQCSYPDYMGRNPLHSCTYPSQKEEEKDTSNSNVHGLGSSFPLCLSVFLVPSGHMYHTICYPVS